MAIGALGAGRLARYWGAVERWKGGPSRTNPGKIASGAVFVDPRRGNAAYKQVWTGDGLVRSTTKERKDETVKQPEQRQEQRQWIVTYGYRTDDGLIYSQPTESGEVTVSAPDMRSARMMAIDLAHDLHGPRCSHVTIYRAVEAGQ